MVQPVYEVKTTTDIAYVVDDDAHDRRYLDIYAPKDSENYPVLIFVSGGGWTQGSKMWVGEDLPPFLILYAEYELSDALAN